MIVKIILLSLRFQYMDYCLMFSGWIFPDCMILSVNSINNKISH